MKSLTNHLAADDLDAFHTEALRSEMRLHLEGCEDCRRLVALDREVLSMMKRLPSYGPRAGFADRVMARVEVAVPTPVPVLSFPKLTTRRLGALAALAAGMVVSVAWSAANRAVLDGWLHGAESALWSSGAALWQQTLAVMTGTSWFESLRQLSGAPVRLAATVVLVIGSYAGGVVALRRLVMPSAGPGANAQL